MEVTKIVFLIAITMALSITLTMKSSTAGHGHVQEASNEQDVHGNVLVPTKRVSRFLAQEYKNPRAADHCNKDYEVCSVQGLNATTCCNNKCVDVHYDHNNCGACKKKCKYTETCCRGQCVNTDYDKRHCGSCNNKCKTGVYCVYGMCEYA